MVIGGQATSKTSSQPSDVRLGSEFGLSASTSSAGMPSTIWLLSSCSRVSLELGLKPYLGDVGRVYGNVVGKISVSPSVIRVAPIAIDPLDLAMSLLALRDYRCCWQWLRWL